MLKIEHLAWSTPTGEEVVKDIDFELGDGKLVVVTGPNGGGKTSLAKLIAGIETPTAGRIVFDGQDISGLDVTQRAKAGIAYAFQQPVRFKGLTVRDLLELAAGGSLPEEQLCALLGQVGLCANEYIDRQMDTSLSGGESKRIEIATVLARKARLVPRIRCPLLPRERWAVLSRWPLLPTLQPPPRWKTSITFSRLSAQRGCSLNLPDRSDY